MSDSRYSEDELEHIIRQAMRLESQGGMSREDLVSAAVEVGLTREAIEHAIDTEDAIIRARRSQRERHEKAVRRFKRHASGMAILVLMLFLIDAMTYGNWWFQWPLLGIGAGLAFKARNLFFPR